MAGRILKSFINFLFFFRFAFSFDSCSESICVSTWMSNQMNQKKQMQSLTEIMIDEPKHILAFIFSRKSTCGWSYTSNMEDFWQMPLQEEIKSLRSLRDNVYSSRGSSLCDRTRCCSSAAEGYGQLLILNVLHKEAAFFRFVSGFKDVMFFKDWASGLREKLGALSFLADARNASILFVI